MILRETIGSWLQWSVSLIVTIVVLIVTIKHYSNDHRFKLFFRIWDGVEEHSSNGVTAKGYGYTIHVINAGPAIAKIKFLGITPRISTIRLILYNYRIRLYDRYPILRKYLKRQIPESFDERKLNIDEAFFDLFDTDGYTFLKNMNDELVVKFKLEEFNNTIVRMIKRNRLVEKKVLKGKDIYYDYTFISFDGKLNRLRMSLGKKSKSYNEIIKSLKSVQKVSD